MAESREGRQTELDDRDAGMSQDTVVDFNETERILGQVLVALTKGESKNYVCKLERSGFKVWKQMVIHFVPKICAQRSVAYSRVTHPVSQVGLTSTRPTTLQNASNIMRTWEQWLKCNTSSK